MNSLFAPWRLPYLKGTKPDHCIFCVGKPADDPGRYILYRGRLAFVIMNAYPYSNGHLMVAPYAHASDLDALPPPALGELMVATRLAIDVLRGVYAPQGFNVGINFGKAAGAGIEEHLHVHIVPRWIGDTNFMTTVADVRVIPEDLRHAYAQLRPEFLKRARAGRTRAGRPAAHRSRS
ncbi:MAG TPA: HIT domain-containing protein [Nitrospiria bacterium]|nr:HIT domain-containing protein [Nitrospiria bacterium]